MTACHGKAGVLAGGGWDPLAVSAGEGGRVAEDKVPGVEAHAAYRAPVVATSCASGAEARFAARLALKADPSGAGMRQQAFASEESHDEVVEGGSAEVRAVVHYQDAEVAGVTPQAVREEVVWGT